MKVETIFQYLLLITTITIRIIALYPNILTNKTRKWNIEILTKVVEKILIILVVKKNVSKKRITRIWSFTLDLKLLKNITKTVKISLKMKAWILQLLLFLLLSLQLRIRKFIKILLPLCFKHSCNPLHNNLAQPLLTKDIWVLLSTVLLNPSMKIFLRRMTYLKHLWPE